MTKKITITILLVFFGTNVFADKFKNTFKFSSGIFTSFAIHEAAHFITAHITNTDLDWYCGNPNQPLSFTHEEVDSDTAIVIAASGLTAQLVCSEVVLHSKVDKNSYFIRGMMFWNILNPISYALDYWFIHRTNYMDDNGNYRGDIQGIEHYAGETTANIFAASITAISAFQGYRYWKTQTWSRWYVKPKNNGFQITYNIKF